MLWHYHGKKFTLQNLPWLSILKEFKLLTPNRKRKQHKPFARASSRRVLFSTGTRAGTRARARTRANVTTIGCVRRRVLYTVVRLTPF